MTNARTHVFRPFSVLLGSVILCLLCRGAGAVQGQEQNRDQPPAQTDSPVGNVKAFSLNDPRRGQLLDALQRLFGEEGIEGVGTGETDAVVVRGSGDVLRALEAMLGQLEQPPATGDDRPPPDPAAPRSVPARRPSSPAGQMSDDPSLLPVRSGVRQPTTIRWLAPEGTEVRQGDLVALLDDSDLIDQAEALRVEIAELEASAAPSPDDVARRLRIQRQASQRALQVAELHLEQFTDSAGEAAYERGDVEGQIVIAEQATEMTQARLERVSQLVDSGQASQHDLAEARLADVKARTELLQAQARRQLLSEHVHPRRLAELQRNVAEAQWVVQLADIEAEEQIARAKAQSAAWRTRRDIADDRLERIEQQIASCRVLAPVDGTVLRALPQRSDDPRPRAGVPVRPDQTVLLLRRDLPARQ